MADRSSLSPSAAAEPARSRSPAVLAEEGWASRLAALVGGGLAVLSVSGLVIYLAPFSRWTQLTVLAHVVLGACLMLPVAVYLRRHVAVWLRQKVTASMFFGFALLAAVVVALVTGVLGAGLALFANRLQPGVDFVHLVAGVTALALLLGHLASAALRRWPAARKTDGLRAAMTTFGRRLAVLTVGGLAAVGVGSFLLPVSDGRFPVPDEYTLPAYAQQFEEYRGNPFAPTFARTVDLEMVEPSVLANSASCGSAGCHEQILAEWQPSAHRFSAMNPPFLEIQRRFAADREPAETRYCAGCHDPISLFAGAKDLHNLDLASEGVDEGISCAVCHSISQVDQRGNADYVLTPPSKYLWEATTGLRKRVSDFLIRAYPRQHLADYDRALLRTPEFCASCHKQFIPEALNRFGMVASQNQYDEWKNGHWHSEDVEVDLSCRDCHMRLVASEDPGRGESGDVRRSEEDRAHRHHGTIATNNFMPALLDLPHWGTHVEATNAWMRGETVLPELGDLWPAGPVASLTLAAPEEAVAGEEIEVRVVVTNRKAGHNFITGPLDFVRSWVHLRFVDAQGRVLDELGQIDPQTRRIMDRAGVEHQTANARDEGTLVLESMPIDEDGRVLRQHELWRKAGGTGKRVIFPMYSDSQRYRVRLPPDARGTIRVEAALNYRRYRQEFLDLVVPGLEERTGVFQPLVTQSRASTTIEVVAP